MITAQSEDLAEGRKVLKKFTDNVDFQGANFFLTMRGRIAENVSFHDDMARTVIILGSPFPDKSHPEMSAKLRSHQEMSNKLKGTTAEQAEQDFVQSNAMSIVNRLLTIPIKHINDFGALIIIGSEYAKLEQYMVSWATENMQKSHTLDDVPIALKSFFEMATNASFKRIKNTQTSADSYKSRLVAQTTDLKQMNEKLREVKLERKKFVPLNKERQKMYEDYLRKEKEKEEELRKPTSKIRTNSGEIKDATPQAPLELPVPNKVISLYALHQDI